MKQDTKFIVWHRGDCTVFEDETQAMDFIYESREGTPDAVFNGWQQSNRGNNMVAILSGYDKGFQLEKTEALQEFFLPKNAPTKAVEKGGDLAE